MRRVDRRIGWYARLFWTGFLVIVLGVVLWPTAANSAPTATRLDWGVGAPIPDKRIGFALAAAPNSKLYAVGGIVGSNFTNTVEEYDPAANSWAEKAPMPTARWHLALAAAANGRLYAVGGDGDNCSSPPGEDQPCNTVEEYDPDANTWTANAPLPTPRRNLGLAAAPNGKLYAVGGAQDTTPPFVMNVVEEYDPATNTWATRAPMPTPREAFGLTATPNGKLDAVGGSSTLTSDLTALEEYDPSTNTWVTKAPLPTSSVDFLGFAAAPNGKLYAMGGDKGLATTVAIVEEYDPSTNTWAAKASMPTPREQFMLAAAPNGKLYAVGGGLQQNGGNTFSFLAPTDVYDPSNDTWVKPFGTHSNFVALYAPAIVSDGTHLYVFAGATKAGGSIVPTATSLEYTPATDTWRSLPSVPTPRYSAAAARATNGKIYVIGGFNGGLGGFLNTVEEFDPAGNGGAGSWRTAADGVAHLQQTRGFPGVAAGSNGKVYAFGGGEDSTVLRTVEEYDTTTNHWSSLSALMPTPRDVFGTAMIPSSPNDLLYAVGGENFNGGSGAGAGPLVAISTVEWLPLPTSGSASSSTWGHIASLPEPRSLLAAAASPNQTVYALGGSPTDGAHPTPAYDVFEYDPSTGSWSGDGTHVGPIRAGLPTARFGLGAVWVGRELFGVGGATGANGTIDPVDTFEKAVLSSLPIATVGGPYTARFGGTVTLNASGTDPQGEALSYAWDVDGDTLYETAGQNPTVSVAGLTPGNHTVRVRVLNTDGGYALGVVTLTVQPAEQVSFVTQPGGAPAGSLLNPQPVVQVADLNGVRDLTYNGPVTLSLNANPTNTALSGTTTVNAVAGVATFTDLSVGNVGNGYTIQAVASGATSVTSLPFSITIPPTITPVGQPPAEPTATATPVQTSPGGPPPTIAPTLTPEAVTLPVTQSSPDHLLVTISGRAGETIQSVRWTPSPAFAIETTSGVPLGGGVLTLPPGTPSTVIVVHRLGTGGVTVPLTITGSFGTWQTFVGGGPDAW